MEASFKIEVGKLMIKELKEDRDMLTKTKINLKIIMKSMKNVRKDNKRYRLLILGYKSNSEIADKRQSIVKSIFGELKVDEGIIFSEQYSSSDESNESLSRENKNMKSKYNS